MSGIKCAFLGAALDAQIKKDKSGKDYLSITMLPEENSEKIWVTVRKDTTTTHAMDKLLAEIAPGRMLYIEGSISLKRWEGENKKACAALIVDASHVEVQFLGEKEKAAEKIAETKPAPLKAKAPAEAPVKPTAAKRQGRTNVELATFVGPAPRKRGKNGDAEPFNDPLPYPLA